MDKNINGLLCKLDDEIDRKCFEIKQGNMNRMLQSAFIRACALFIIVPMLLVFAGISLWAFCIPAILFLTICFCFLLPFAFSNKLGGLE
jgi:ABC-type polysaccharide/polyol phosphate export permease